MHLFVKLILYVSPQFQIKFDSMLEDINMLLNGADIPNLYPAEEKALVIEKIQAYVAKNNIQVYY